MENVDPIDKAKQANYDLGGKMMLICIVILFIVIVIMICIHIYIRWYLRRARHRQHHLRRSRNRQSRGSHFVFYIDPALTANSRGLEASVISSLPVFTFSPNSEPVECAVCLSEFEDGETGRVLPTCKHSFHIECIDMWFVSHSTCPLCRVHVESPPQQEVVVNVSEPEPGSSSEEVNRSGAGVCSSSSSSVGKSLSFVSLGTESVYDSASSSFRSPMSRMLSFKRILSRERKASLDVERGSELTQ